MSSHGMGVAFRLGMSTNLSRRKTLGLLAALPAGGLAHARAARRKDGSLGEIAARAGVVYGASAGTVIFDDAEYRLLYLKHCKALTTDVDMKFDWLRPEAGKWDWAPADRLAAFAERTGMTLRGHALIWNENAPDWLKALSLAEIRRVFDEHIETVVARYAGRVAVWDVVNEPFWPGHGKPGGYRTGPWYEAFGPGYVERALKRARAVDPHVRLAINEAHCERDDGVGRAIREGMARLVAQLRDVDAPLDALGFQGHLQPGRPYDDAAFAAFLRRFSGLELHITELDVNDETFPAAIRERDALVARRYHDFLSAVLAVPAVNTVINWQLADHYSWYNDLARSGQLRSRRAPRPLPFDSAYRRKPAWFAMARAFRERKAS